MDEDKKEEQKKANVDRSKLEADIKAQKDLASKVKFVKSIVLYMEDIAGLFDMRILRSQGCN